VDLKELAECLLQDWFDVYVENLDQQFWNTDTMGRNEYAEKYAKAEDRFRELKKKINEDY
jgi:hypothetical protein